MICRGNRVEDIARSTNRCISQQRHNMDASHWSLPALVPASGTNSEDNDDVHSLSLGAIVREKVFDRKARRTTSLFEPAREK
jgi:hypothetical protein